MPSSLVGLRHSLRVRLAATFAVFGMLVSLLLSIALFLAAQHTSDRLMDETLRSELDDYLSRRARNPSSPPPVTLNIRGYVIKPGGTNDDVPVPVLNLPPGKHQLSIAGIPYRVSAVEDGGTRYVMMFDESRQRQREERFFLFLVLGTVAMALVSAGLGWWLAGRVVAPMSELARLISSHPEQPGRTAEFSDDEIGKLASGIFGEYVSRMHAFISREQAFTTDVSHELRTPLSIVRGVVELMEDDERLDELQHDRIERIRRAVYGMIDITSALLMMARETSLRDPAGVPCDVCAVVGDVIDTHRHLVGPAMSVQFDCRSHPRLAAEATLLKIVVSNLVLNAFTHADAGTVAIVVEPDGMTVSDTGRGILGEELGKVFQKHFKGADSSGAGIGLSLVKRICERYGWDIAIESAVGRGTSVRLVYRSTLIPP